MNVEGLTDRQVALLAAVQVKAATPHVNTITLAKTYLAFLEGRS